MKNSTNSQPNPQFIDVEDSKPVCPKCGSHNIRKNGHIHNGKQNHQCKDCGRQFVEGNQKKYISNFLRNLVDKLLLEKISLAGICRVLGVSGTWLQEYVNATYAKVSRELNVSAKPPGKLIIQCDELWSYVQKKDNQQWVWLALDLNTREIVGCYVGDRSQKSAQQLWESLPPVYRQCAVCYSDFWKAYECVFPKKRHKAVSKSSGKTSHIERFNNTLRQRISRLVRKTLSFSKKLENHIGALWYFIHHYNESLHI